MILTYTYLPVDIGESCCDVTLTKALGKERLIWLILPGPNPSLREVREETQAGTEAYTIEEGC